VKGTRGIALKHRGHQEGEEKIDDRIDDGSHIGQLARESADGPEEQRDRDDEAGKVKRDARAEGDGLSDQAND